jgi:hypothetical protein
VLEYDVRGNGCQTLTAAGEADFAAAIFGLRVSLLAWLLVGAGVLTGRWRRRLEGSPRREMVLGGWLLGVFAAAVAVWAGPGFEGFGKAGLLVLYTPAVLLVSGGLMTFGTLRGGAPRPVTLLLLSLGLLVVALNAGVWLGGIDEVALC